MVIPILCSVCLADSYYLDNVTLADTFVSRTTFYHEWHKLTNFTNAFAQIWLNSCHSSIRDLEM